MVFRFLVVRCRCGGLLEVRCWGRRVLRGLLATGRRVDGLLRISSIGLRRRVLGLQVSCSRLCSGFAVRCGWLVVLLRTLDSVTRWVWGRRR